MKRVYQTSYGRNKGNCLTACVASMMDLPIDGVPEFCVDGEWFDRLATFCEGNGFSLAHWKPDYAFLPINALLIVCMHLEGTDEQHAVICRTVRVKNEPMENGDTRMHWEARLVHDPNERGYPPFTDVAMYLAIWPSQDVR